MYHLECPYHTQHVKYNDVFNWTATYRRDSDLVAPYEKFVYYDSSVRQLNRPLKNYAANKTKQVAWFVSNCGARNGRLQYAHELQKYIAVDIYGACGSKKCPRYALLVIYHFFDVFITVALATWPKIISGKHWNWCMHSALLDTQKPGAYRPYKNKSYKKHNAKTRD